MRYLSLIILSVIFIQGCSTYSSVLKSNDLNLKEQTAMKLYNKKDYDKAIPLFEELIAYSKCTKKGEDLYYYYCYCFFGNEEYFLAAYNFKTLATTYPNGTHAEECLYMSAKCYYYVSPRTSLDQSSTEKAINELQLFINEYPTSSYVSQANDMIDLMRRKLEKKDYDAAKLYFDMENYKAATTSFGNLIKKYPDSPKIDEISFMALKSSYLLAINSIEEKKHDRLGQTINVYTTFAERFPTSKYSKEAKDIYDDCTKMLSKTTNKS